MPLCAGTSLALIIPTSITSFTTHRKRDAVNFSLSETMECSDHRGRAWRDRIGSLRAGRGVQSRVRVYRTAHGGSADIPRSMADARRGRPPASPAALRFDHRIVRIADRNWRRHPIEHHHDVPWPHHIHRVDRDVSRGWRNGLHPGSAWDTWRPAGDWMGITAVFRRVRLNRGGVSSHAGEYSHGAAGRVGCASCVQSDGSSSALQRISSSSEGNLG